MRKTNKKQVKTTTKQKILLIMFGIFLALFILEIGLRIGGFVVSSYQRISNKEGSDVDYRILCLGESTTADLYGNNNSWPAQLEIVLNNKSSKIKFKVFNDGVGGTNTAFILSRLKGNLDKYKPNIIITMMRINDEGLNIKYEETLKVKINLLFEDLRVYKLNKLLWIAWKNKIQNNVIDDISTLEEQGSIKEEDKSEAEKYIELGIDYQEQGKFKEAEEMFMKAIEINPDDEGIYIELGGIYHEQGKFKEAEEVFGKVIGINPNNYEAYIGLEWIYWKEKRYKEAEEILKKAVKINPNNDRAYLGLGRVYWEEKRYKEAEEILKKAVKINPNNDEIYTRLMHVYQKLNIFDKEIEELYRKRGVGFKLTEDIPNEDVTKYHYQLLYKELNKKGIRYIAMQYPTLNINELKNMFEGDEDIIFVSNEENFKKALESGKYEDYFIDHITNTFGHATPKGNRLIAENIANAILEKLRIN